MRWLLPAVCCLHLAAQPVLDPGVRNGPAAAGEAVAGLSQTESNLWEDSRGRFAQATTVTGDGGTLPGLGPRFNHTSCAGCHFYPSIGGSSPSTNPQVDAATQAGAHNTIPAFLSVRGPVRVARFKYAPDGSRDGNVQPLFTIAGRSDAPGCELPQPDFAAAAESGNLALRIPTPLYGAGLIEAIADRTIVASWEATADARKAAGIGGRPNRNASDGSITRFGWKAQVQSLEFFAGEALRVEQGVSNELFPREGVDAPECIFNASPEDATRVDRGTISQAFRAAFFMRLLGPPRASADAAGEGAALFQKVGCALCHTPTLRTGKSNPPSLSGQEVRLYSDLLLHRMGAGLADDIVQGSAQGDEFRTAPLWGLGQRIFLLHDGRTADLLEAIRLHAGEGSEADAVVDAFGALADAEQQRLLNFLRSL